VALPTARVRQRMSTGAEDAFLRRALELAGRGWGRVAPNPMVGCVLVRSGEVVGEGWHRDYGGPHAEVEALRAAGERARGATAFVSLEPCSHHGKTPPCTTALVEAGVARVVFGAADPHARAAGGARALRAAGIDVEGPLAEAATRDLDPAFFHRHESAAAERPWLALKLALSLDARIADAAGRSAWITGEEARSEVHRLRAGHAAVGVGVGTALADDPSLTVRGPVVPRVAPSRVVFDRTLRLPPEGRLARGAREVPLVLVCGPAAPPERRRALEAAGARVLVADGLPAQLRALRAAGIDSLLVEGGAGVAGSLLAAGAVDRMFLFYAPVLLGPSGSSPFAAVPDLPLGETLRWRSLGSRRLGPDTLLVLARPAEPVPPAASAW
jgi:diaminohydroxyphosphoribosylaminopyrimidine deaminase / 5-amino-6-(5-phosphoribosylamino)uracil reductase